MNLPSIFKSAPAMKPSQQPQKSEKVDTIPQDMFGLGIQVFKIESRKQIAGNAKSLSKARNDIKVIENPRKTNNIPAIPKPKKTSALLPSINKTPSQKEYRLQGVTKTDSILTRKSVEKTNQFIKKVDAIQEYSHQYPTQQKNNNISKNKTFNGARSANKSGEVSQPQVATQPTKSIHKEQWRSSLNWLRKYYTSYNQFQTNEQSKIGRKKNQEYLSQDANFTEAYIRNNEENFYTTMSLYDPLDIENYKISQKQCGFVDLHYEDYVAE